MDLLLDTATETLLDTLNLLPFLLVTYVFLEAVEHGLSGSLGAAVSRAGAAGPAVGAFFGAIPQCGFSAMTATFYAGGVVSAGTLVAVVLSTSDEMLPVFLAHGAGIPQIGRIVVIKVLAGLIGGYTVDLCRRAWKGSPERPRRIHDICERAGCGCHGADHVNHTDYGQQPRSIWLTVLRSALIHTVQVAIFILIVGFAFELSIELVGKAALAAFLSGSPVISNLCAGLVGLIPTCGVSVVLCELYLEGVLAAGPTLTGLLASGGVGLLVLWRTNVNLRQNALITLAVYLISVCFGLAATFSGLSF